ncbi:MAG: KH domain-containing protein [Clostridiales bacterium]|jgi:spoIIIJ-associated protein|nr:KH domain-containing protein [Clostridiales bacterium]
MKSYESSGRNVEEAISAGLDKMGLSIGEVTVDILEEGSKGLFGLFGSRQAVVRLTAKEQEEPRAMHDIFADSLAAPADRKPAQPPKAKQQKAPEKKAKATPPSKQPDQPQRQAADAAPEVKKEKPARQSRKRKPKAQAKEKPLVKPVVPAPAAEPGTAAGEAQAFLLELTRLMGVEVSIHVITDEEGNVRANMEGDTQGILIGRRGETLDAIQYLTSLLINKGKEGYTRFTLDSEGYRARREDVLVRLANRMANRAQKTGRRTTLEPMNPYERRIIHSALQAREDVTTHSEGEEPNRHVVITVNKGAVKQAAPKTDEDATESSSES